MQCIIGWCWQKSNDHAFVTKANSCWAWCKRRSVCERLAASADCFICQLEKWLSYWSYSFPWWVLPPWAHFKTNKLQLVAFFWCQMDGTSLSSPSTRSSHELEHLPQWLLLLILLRNMQSICTGNSMKCSQNRTCFYAQAPGARVKTAQGRSYDLSHFNSSSLFMGEQQSADPGINLLREYR